MTEQVATKKKDIPLWVGVLLILAGLGGAGWFVWSQVSGFWTGPKGVFTIEGLPSSQAAIQPRPARPNTQNLPQTSVRQLNPTTWRAFGRNVNVMARKRDSAISIDMRVLAQQPLPPDASWLNILRRRLQEKSTLAAELGLTNEQVNAIRALPTSNQFAVDLDAATTKGFVDLFTRYAAAADAAQKTAVDHEIGRKLAEVGPKLLPAAERRARKQFADLKASAGDEKWQKLHDYVTNPPPSAPPVPPAPPAPPTPAIPTPAVTTAPAVPAT